MLVGRGPHVFFASEAENPLSGMLQPSNSLLRMTIRSTRVSGTPSVASISKSARA